jgi:hypothetical protein
MNARRRTTVLATLLILVIAAPPASARTFSLAEFEGIYNLRVSYGALYRLRDADRDLLAIVNGGTARSANIDDGNLNYGEGLVSNMVRATGELALRRGAFGVYLRGAAFYDFENKNSDPDPTELSGSADKLVGSDIELRESYVNWNLSPGGMPVVFRVGQQILNWSETTFIRDGLDLINPADLVTALQPASDFEDLRNPQRMVWGAANITETFSLEAYYQYEWQPVELPPVGWYFSSNDSVGGDGMGDWRYGAGTVSDLGTDLDALYELPPGTLGFDEDYQKLDGRLRDTPSDLGQYGIALIGFLPGRTALKTGFHYMRYHSRLPLLSTRTGSLAAVAATAEPFVAARADALADIYLDNGLDAPEAAARGRAAAEELTLSDYGNEASLFAEYPEDIDAFGVSFSTSVPGTGILLAGEASHHLDFPFQLAPGQVTQAVFSPVLFDDQVGDTTLGEFGPGEVIHGYERLDRTQVSVQVGRILPGRFGASRIVLNADAAWIRVHDLPGAGEAPLTSDDEDSWGYRLQIAASYLGVLGAINLQPFALFTHDVDGSTPLPLQTFVEDRKSVTVGLRGSYINRLSAEVRFTGFFHGGRANRLRDRDFLRLQVSYSL